MLRRCGSELPQRLTTKKNKKKNKKNNNGGSDHFATEARDVAWGPRVLDQGSFSVEQWSGVQRLWFGFVYFCFRVVNAKVLGLFRAFQVGLPLGQSSRLLRPLVRACATIWIRVVCGQMSLGCHGFLLFVKPAPPPPPPPNLAFPSSRACVKIGGSRQVFVFPFEPKYSKITALCCLFFASGGLTNIRLCWYAIQNEAGCAIQHSLCNLKAPACLSCMGIREQHVEQYIGNMR